MTRGWRIIGVVLLAAALASVTGGCSAVRLSYNQLPRIAYWYLDDYVDFDSAQSGAVDLALVDLQTWHRNTELPRFGALLREAQELAQGDVSASQVCAFNARLVQRLMAVADRAEAPAAALLQRLDTAQIRNVQRKFDKVDAKYRSEWIDLPISEQATKRFDKFVERSEDFYGPLTDSQRALLHDQTRQSVFSASMSVTERRERQQVIVQALRLIRAPATTQVQATQAVHAVVERIATPPEGPWRVHRQALREEACRNIAALHNSTSADQRRRAVERLRAYEADVVALIGQAG